MKDLREISLETTNGCSYYLAKELLSEYNILVAFTGRAGGVSREPFKGLNLGFHVGDDPENVIANRRAISEALNIDFNRMTCAEQVHGSTVALVDETTAGRGAFSFNDSISGVDALIVDRPNIPLALFFADCVPVVIADPYRKVVAVVHAGWRGVLDRIIEKAVSSMMEFGDASIDNMIAFIGPAIGGCCFEIGEDLLKRFQERFEDEGLWLSAGNRIDLRELARLQLDKCGIESDRATVLDFCTVCNSDLLFSYRAENGITGRHAAIINIFK
jgi:YfiH family protein